MSFENSQTVEYGVNPLPERRAAIAQAYRTIARYPVYLAIATTGWDFFPEWGKAARSSEEILEICILESDGRVLFESLVKPRGSISDYAYCVHRITKRMVKDAPTWENVLAQVNQVLAARHVAVYDAERKLRVLAQTNALYNLSWTVDTRSCFCVKRLYAHFNGKVYADGLNSTWLGVWHAARNLGIPHGKWHRAHEDAQLTRAVLKHIAAKYVVQPPDAPLPRRVSRMERWLRRILDF